MRLLFDAFELNPNSPKSKGIYRYAVGLARAMASALAVDDELIIVCNGANVSCFSDLTELKGVSVRCLRPGMPGHFWRQIWMRIWAGLFVRQFGVGVYFSPKGFIPANLGWPRSVRRLCVMHDLIPFWYFSNHPDFFGWIERLMVGSAFKHSVRHADGIVAISGETRDALLTAGADSWRVGLVYNGVDFNECAVDYKDVRSPYIFAMSSGLPHKNLTALLNSYRIYRELAGDKAWGLKICGPQYIKEEGVEALGSVSESELTRLYKEASLFVFLSLIEGFGYPPIEALRVGTPVLCSDIAVFHEVCGGLASYVDPRDTQAIANAMVALSAGVPSLNARKILREHAVNLITQRFSWRQCANGVLALVRSTLKRGSR
jgi:glycosyltransferase involved in cell wall biosynthesis